MSILNHWKGRGYQFEEGLNMPPGKIKVNNRTLCFYSDQEPTKGQSMIRWTMQIFLGRKLKDIEVVRFKTPDRTDLRLSNLKWISKQATAKELFSVNGPPILGYSHCMCGCGEALNVDKQGDQPHAFVVGHSPADKRRMTTIEAAVDKAEKNVRKHRKKKKPRVEDPSITEELHTQKNPWDPQHWSLTGQGEMMKRDPVAGRVLAMMSDPLYQYRPLFEKMISGLPWEKFKCVLNTLLQMES